MDGRVVLMAKLGRPLISPQLPLPLPLSLGMWEEERALWMTRVVWLLRRVVDLDNNLSAWLVFRPAAAASAAALFLSNLLFSALVAAFCNSCSSLSVRNPEPGA